MSDAGTATGRRVAVTGASGLIGSALVAALEREGWRVLRLVRGRPGAGQAAWDPETGRMDAGALEGVDAVVHLAGENVGQRWTPRARARIRRSRVEGTRLVAETLASLRTPPEVLVSASAVGYYGSRGDEPLDERSPAGDDFLARLTRDWEAAATPAAGAGIRVVHPRFGLVLARQGGALGRMLPVFRLGGGGPLGSGRQWVSWVSIEDVARALRFMLAEPTLAGPVNVTAPEPVTNAEFTRALGRVLGRPTLLRVPETALRLAFGEMARGTLLASQRALPRRLLEAGFTFRYPHLEDALRAVLRGQR